MSDLLAGKTGLICNVANHRSAAWAIAKAADAQGARIAIGYLGDRELKQLDKLIGELSQPPLLVPCDATNDETLTAMADKVGAEFGQLDFLVHAIAFAKIEDLRGKFADTSRDGFLLAHNISAYSLVALSRAVTPLFKNGGSVITLTYIGSERSVPNYNVMGVAKASLESTMRYLANDLGPQGVRVNAISAGPMRTLAAAAIGDFGKMYNAFAERVPLRRNTTQDDVANTCVYLASDLSCGVTGDVIYVDNGFHIMGA